MGLNNTGTVGEIDASTGAIVRSISVPSAGNISSDGTHVWVTAGEGVSEITASTGSLVNTLYLGPGLLGGVSSDGTDVWVTNFTANTVIKLTA